MLKIVYPSVMSKELLAAAISAVTRTQIVAYQSGNPTGLTTTTPKPQPHQQLDSDSLQNAHLIQGPVRTFNPNSQNVQDQQQSSATQSTSTMVKTVVSDRKPKVDDKGKTGLIIIYIKTLTGKKIALRCDPAIDTIQGIKDKIHVIENIPSAQQCLKYSGQEVQNIQTLGFYRVRNKTTLYLTVVVVDKVFPDSPPSPIIYLPSSLLAPEFNINFSNFTQYEEVLHRRGGCRYNRPIGWVRMALNVDRFGPDKSWLGPVKRKSPASIVPGEWPGTAKLLNMSATLLHNLNCGSCIQDSRFFLYFSVSYHGTERTKARSIAEEGYLLTKGKRFAFGYGVYTTPDIDEAENFAKIFLYEGHSYKVVIQNRVNPETLQRVIIRVRGCPRPKEYWISPEEGVRPYAFCIKRCDGKNSDVKSSSLPKRRDAKDKIIDGCLCV